VLFLPLACLARPVVSVAGPTVLLSSGRHVVAGYGAA